MNILFGLLVKKSVNLKKVIMTVIAKHFRRKA